MRAAGPGAIKPAGIARQDDVAYEDRDPVAPVHLFGNLLGEPAGAREPLAEHGADRVEDEHLIARAVVAPSGAARDGARSPRRRPGVERRPGRGRRFAREAPAALAAVEGRTAAS